MQIDVMKFQHLGRVAASLWLQHWVGAIPDQLRIEANAPELAAVDFFFGIIPLNDFAGIVGNSFRDPDKTADRLPRRHGRIVKSAETVIDRIFGAIIEHGLR